MHPMQIWQTPFTSDEHAAKAPSQGHLPGEDRQRRPGARYLRGAQHPAHDRGPGEPGDEPGATVYEDLISACVRMGDAHYWLDRDEVSNLAATLDRGAFERTELILDEFEKVKALRAQAQEPRSPTPRRLSRSS